MLYWSGCRQPVDDLLYTVSVTVGAYTNTNSSCIVVFHATSKQHFTIAQRKGAERYRNCKLLSLFFRYTHNQAGCVYRYILMDRVTQFSDRITKLLQSQNIIGLRLSGHFVVGQLAYCTWLANEVFLPSAGCVPLLAFQQPSRHKSCDNVRRMTGTIIRTVQSCRPMYHIIVQGHKRNKKRAVLKDVLTRDLSFGFRTSGYSGCFVCLHFLRIFSCSF